MTLAQKTIKILVVDDSAFMRKALQMMLESDPCIKVIGMARDGEEAIEKAKRLKPDLITMDIEMPRMDGLTALREIMAHNPTPVMMISSLTTDGASATLDALEMGAVDFIPKQLSYVSLDIIKIKDELLAKIKAIVKRKTALMTRLRYQSASRKYSHGSGRATTGKQRSVIKTTQPILTIKKRNHLVRVVAIGCSTGGPPALQALIPKLPSNLPVPILVVQHMPAKFTESLAIRLDGMSQVSVTQAENGEPLEAGHVYIAPGGKQMTIRKAGVNSYVNISDGDKDTLYHPCVDITFGSIAKYYSSNILATILTGMGNNGLIGVREIKNNGGVTVAQNEETCVVYGMPKAIVDAKLADHVVPIENIAAEICSYF